MIKMILISLMILTVARVGWAAPGGEERELEAVSADAEACTDGLCPKNTVMSNRDKMSNADVIKLADIIFNDLKDKPLPPLPNSKTSK